MSNDTPAMLPLHDDVKAVVWRIFGHGSSPLAERSSYELVGPIVRKRCKSISPRLQRTNIVAIQQWFNPDGDHHWIRPDRREIVADLILKGIEGNRPGPEVWAVGSIDTALAARLTRGRWSTEKIGRFIDATLQTLEKLREKGTVLDSAHLYRFDHTTVEIAEASIRGKGRLETFCNLDNRNLDLVLDGLPPAVGNLVELLVELWRQDFRVLIEKLDHPVMQARATRHRILASRSMDHRETLKWISDDSCDALVAMAIVHTLKTVNQLDYDLRCAGRRSSDEHGWATELRPPEDNLDVAAARLLTDLVERLVELDPLESARWIGEVLSSAPFVLHPDRNHTPPHRIEQLEEACTKALVRIVRKSWSDGLVSTLCSGLRLTPVKSWTRHLAETAWKARNVAPAQATKIARSTLGEHERQLADQSDYKNVYLDLSRSDDQTWIQGLGAALALSEEDLDLSRWISAQCRALPLTVWDAEESVEAFMAADSVAIHWFLIAFFAIPRLQELNRPPDPAKVRNLAETFWNHRRFVQGYSHDSFQDPIAEELVSRSVIEFGDPSDTWLLEKASDIGVGPMSLFALVDQRQRKAIREGRADVGYDEMFRAEYVRIATDRFREARRFSLQKLHSWGLVWRALEAPDQACRTANAIIAFPLERGDRHYRIVALRLFALAASNKKLGRASSAQMRALYNELWPHYTHAIGEERHERDEIDKLLDAAAERRP